jgi:KaiC/GvpD/RAD55 family RecA-like ATPase
MRPVRTLSVSDREHLKIRRGVKLFTGIDALDRIFGGFPDGSVILVSGLPGSGFDIFAQQILYTASAAGNCNTLYIAADRPPLEVESEMAERGWRIDTLGEKRWEFLDAYTVKQNVLKGIASAKGFSDLFRGLPSLIKEGRWTAVDTLSSFIEALRFEEVLDVLGELVEKARDSGGLHLLLVVEGLHDEKTMIKLTHTVDGLLDLTLESRYAEPVGLITVKKLRRMNHVKRVISYRITENGLVIETVTRIV